VHPGQLISNPALPPIAGLGLETIDEIDDVVEAAACAGANAASGDCNGQMGLAGAGAADQHGITLLGDEVAAGEVAHKRFVNRRILEPGVVESLASGSLAMVSWYLIERACFSFTSAVSRSPTMRCGSCWRLPAVAMISSKAAFMPWRLSSPMRSESWGRSIRRASWSCRNGPNG